jgi:adenine-specific DNA-methyltransferase
VACVQLLNKNGKIAFVIPAELLQVAYAEDLRLYLSNSFSKITLITFRELVFPSIEQEIILFIGEKDEKAECENALIGVKELQSLDELDNFSFHDIKYQKVKHTKEKWTKYFTNDNEVKLIESIKQDDRFVQFQDISIVNVGITTGDNNYFSVNDDVVKEFKFKNIALPLIGRSAHARGVYFTKEDWKYNIGKGKNAYLLCFPDIPYDKYPEEHKQYIDMGEKKGVHKGYKCSIRDKWYRVPSIWVPDAFFLRRNDSFPKFVLNEIDAVSTDTMHRIKFKDGIDRHKALLSYYNSITFAFTEINGRSYGGGVLEVLPGEVSAILLPKVDMLDEKETSKLIEIIDENVRSQGNIEEVLDIIDREVLVKHLKIDKEICVQFRDIWKKLMTRRKGRAR